MMHIDQHFLDLDLMSVADLPDPSRLPASGQRHSYLLPSDLTGFMYAEPGADFSAIAQLQAEALMHGDLLALLGGAPGATASSGLPASSVSALVRGSLSDGTSGSTHATDSHGADCLAAAGSMFGDPAASDGPDPDFLSR
ncbi:hypothetical protein F751_0603 [Auxenochlorella protothecoides]|uniref:Uncharacterized protein n=1 Tax=Auxenochlorella protothecoides TaxID=3075 RepID=A0A087SIM2_AUXPR|nr:hypothetical protein F751_0603 [Auxenochlorella protothecoides]KFM25576.1 hypothetical protein F751_0603 [Auxenochlorella protothecoides]